MDEKGRLIPISCEHSSRYSCNERERFEIPCMGGGFGGARKLFFCAASMYIHQVPEAAEAADLAVYVALSRIAF